MADHDVKIRVKAEGADAAAEKVGGIGKAFQRLIAPINMVRTAAATLFRTLGTVSFIIHGVELIVDSVKSLHAWLNRAKTAAFQLMKAGQDARFAAALEKTAEKAKYLKESLAGALENLKKMQQFGAAWSAGQQGVEAAQLNLDEQRALAGVTDDEERQRISEDFAVRRAESGWRNASTGAAAARDAIDGQISEVQRSNEMEESHRATARKRLEDVRAWINDGRLTDEEREKRVRLAEALEKEIEESRRRSEANAALIEELNRQKALLDAPVEQARLEYETVQQQTSNARSERERKQVEEFVKISERNMQKARQQEAQDEFETKAEELRKAEEALKAEPEVHQVRDRISAMGGFATAGAATLAGMSTGGDKSYDELRQHRDLLKQEIEQLKKIVKNTEEGAAVFG